MNKLQKSADSLNNDEELIKLGVLINNFNFTDAIIIIKEIDYNKLTENTHLYHYYSALILERSLTRYNESKHIKNIKAIKDVKLALIVKPDFVPGWRLLAKLYSAIGEFKKASIVHDRLTELSLRQESKEKD